MIGLLFLTLVSANAFHFGGAKTLSSILSKSSQVYSETAIGGDGTNPFGPLMYDCASMDKTMCEYTDMEKCQANFAPNDPDYILCAVVQYCGWSESAGMCFFNFGFIASNPDTCATETASMMICEEMTDAGEFIAYQTYETKPDGTPVDNLDCMTADQIESVFNIPYGVCWDVVQGSLWCDSGSLYLMACEDDAHPVDLTSMFSSAMVKQSPGFGECITDEGDSSSYKYSCTDGNYVQEIFADSATCDGDIFVKLEMTEACHSMDVDVYGSDITLNMMQGCNEEYAIYTKCAKDSPYIDGLSWDAPAAMSKITIGLPGADQCVSVDGGSTYLKGECTDTEVKMMAYSDSACTIMAKEDEGFNLEGAIYSQPTVFAWRYSDEMHSKLHTILQSSQCTEDGKVATIYPAAMFNPSAAKPDGFAMGPYVLATDVEMYVNNGEENVYKDSKGNVLDWGYTSQVQAIPLYADVSLIVRDTPVPPFNPFVSTKKNAAFESVAMKSMVSESVVESLDYSGLSSLLINCFALVGVVSMIYAFAQIGNKQRFTVVPDAEV